MKKYFIYRLKQCIKPFILLFVFGTIIYVLPLSLENYASWNNPPAAPSDFPEYLEYYYNPNYVDLYGTNILIGLALMAAATPVYMFYYKMNRRSVDMYYSLPITRTKLFVTQFLTGLLCVFAAYTLSFWLGFIVIAVKVRRIKYYYYIFCYLASLVPMFTVYSLSTFFYTRANTVIDGLITVAGGFFAGFALMAAAQQIANELFLNRSMPGSYLAFTPFGTFQSLTALFTSVYRTSSGTWTFDPVSQYRFMRDIFELTGGILFTVLGAAATAYMLKSEKNCRAENCGQVTQSIFSYKTLIPVFLICISVWLSDSAVALAVLAFAAIVATMVWRRTFKIGKERAIILAVYIAAAIILAMLVCYLPPFVTPTPAPAPVY